MSKDYLSSLPGEMLEEISKFFREDDNGPHQSYRSLAQTCKSLRAHFQRRIFSYLYLPVDTRIRKFAELLRNNPILASYIRKIGIEVDDMCMGHFQYPPLLAIMHAAGTSSRICLYIGSSTKFFNELCVDIPSNTMTHIFNAPQIILHAITSLHIRSTEQAIPVSLFRLLPNLRMLYGSHLLLTLNVRLAEDHTTQFFRPKLDALVLRHCNPAVITMLCEKILDLSAVNELKVVSTEIESTTLNPNVRNLLAQRLLDCAQSVQKLNLDIGVMDGPFYDLSRLQRLRECTVDLEVRADANPVPPLCQLLRTLPPLSEHDFEYLHLSIEFIDIIPDENNSHVLLPIDTWSNFDTTLVDVVSSGTRAFKLTLDFYIPTRNSLVESLLKTQFVDWGRKHLPMSSQQPNLNIIIHHPYS
ncbi:hypothetical protein BDN70DRAFT_978874 [Pholiota conissans]|uniref:F-box domain-containing protein n=1 Tax=Pholiota conissans TaxID=109636 RepID=A0A9P5YP21_9AGAR|nr:hypothetical protein BDN70DRAFT_978874 [Pholiota conissans]